MQFDNRGSKVADPKKAAQILAAIADCVCNVPVSQVKYGGTIGQSTLLNHQSVSTFTCVGPTKSGGPVSWGLGWGGGGTSPGAGRPSGGPRPAGGQTPHAPARRGRAPRAARGPDSAPSRAPGRQPGPHAGGTPCPLPQPLPYPYPLRPALTRPPALPPPPPPTPSC
jgi:hypothetical protein